MRRTRTGFTLIELMVVVIIIGILATVAVPQYMRTKETASANSAVGLLVMVANANRMCILDNPTNNTTVCNPNTALSNTHALVSKGYIATMDWGNAQYNYYPCSSNGSCSGCSGASGFACATHKNIGGAPYTTWGYYVNGNGVCVELNAAPKCPKM